MPGVVLIISPCCHECLLHHKIQHHGRRYHHFECAIFATLPRHPAGKFSDSSSPFPATSTSPARYHLDAILSRKPSETTSFGVEFFRSGWRTLGTASTTKVLDIPEPGMARSLMISRSTMLLAISMRAVRERRKVHVIWKQHINETIATLAYSKHSKLQPRRRSHGTCQETMHSFAAGGFSKHWLKSTWNCQRLD